MSDIDAAFYSLSNEYNPSIKPSSVYDIDFLRQDPLVSSHGLGALITFARPSFDEVDVAQPPVKPVTLPNLNPSSFELLIERAADAYQSNSDFAYIYTDGTFQDGHYALLPAFDKNGGYITLTQAQSIFKKNGLHLGIFSSAGAASRWIKYFNSLGEAFVKLSTPFLDELNFGKFITSLDVNYTIDGASEIKMTITDPEYRFMENNYFQPRRRLVYRGEMFEIGVTEVSQGPGMSPQITVTCWNAAIQKMKRDKKPGNISGDSAYDYALAVAKKFGLKFVGEKTNKRQSINKGTGNNSDENVWTVLTSAANQDEFVLYVMDNTLVYASQQWLLWKFGIDSRQKSKSDGSTETQKFNQMFYNPGGTVPELSNKFTVMGYPSIRYSENDALEGDGRITVMKPNGCIVRPGQTVWIGPKPTLFKGGYLVTSVSFSEGTPDPVEIEFRTPQKPKKQNQPSV